MYNNENKPDRERIANLVEFDSLLTIKYVSRGTSGKLGKIPDRHPLIKKLHHRQSSDIGTGTKVE